ncbi:tRNA pseudouridine(38-40) synthase TruA [Pacificimonas flava]|uniref:tRNA pseudouridine synthase A n=2 Tax=Pacificimonas TaxID=1960290 RepID=A0A219B8W1_9SPHN|nr:MULTISPECIES: tRNA pseudouridine(38-40) synthase TruA [Pacificimonas]MBZ6379993.1 tRNA pseudouridine(38-40) synthase TruA [Pacificimonas aurantium]OWV34805.1 tRNA pseudouridine(38-40) synthase TruA [Pacificimonas flava]
MPRFKLTIEYDGRPFMGWQRQAHGPSVQQCLEEAAAAIFGGTPLVYGCGRTDSGVHALGQVAHVDCPKPLSPFRLSEALNARLRPHPIAILEAEQVADDFHARFDCTGRAYRYVIHNRRAPLTLTAGREWRISKPLDETAMADAAAHLVGRHDFTTFRSVHCQAESPVKTLTRLEVERQGDHVVVEADAPSFLHHQIRSITGCLAMVGDGRWKPRDMKAALDSKDRAALGLNAPPDGLYFVRATYE